VTVDARASTFDEPPELLPRSIWVGSRIFAAGEAFFFLAFLFAFFYLRALNSNGVWRGWPHHHPHPSKAFGIAILICVVASAVALRASTRLAGSAWRPAAGAALALGLAAVALQCAQFASLGFGPTDAGYGSVFVGWTGLFALAALGTMLWLESVLAQSLRGSADVAYLRASVEAVSFSWAVLALVQVAAFVLLYLVA
jgi:heme/copper-type cytochrome/quinol oxidase subunit 3